MNLPNKITMVRVILIPFFVVFMIIHFNNYVTADIPYCSSWAAWAALIAFVVASLTDFLDGHIARSRGLVTDFGKFADPLADKLLVTSCMILFVEFGKIAAWIVIIIIAREFIISGFRMIAAEKGVVIAAGWWGKVKTAVTMVTLVLLLLFTALGLNDGVGTTLYIVEQVLIYLCCFLTVASLIDYLVKNKGVISSF
ncbi:MAG: CDP-diacylglycerol--glycerol-3-phosphate 3-phosphatidyltransferase [Lachnospiraceae bacterium]|nr:CDP-diacylglycerol--glycerol-3-phosphate 3-phosphatidyltransferase [Lachnospiraceae bacterium]